MVVIVNAQQVINQSELIHANSLDEVGTEARNILSDVMWDTM